MLKLLLVLLATPFNAALRGLVLCQMWAWFVVGTFNLPPLSVPVALGCSMIAHLVTAQSHYNLAEKPKDEQVGPIGETVVSAFASVLALGIAYVVHLFV